LPELWLLGDEWAQVARDRTHIAVRQLEPRFSKRVGELLRMIVETLRNRRINGIHPERQIGRQHERRVLLRRIVGIWNRAIPRPILRSPLVCACRTLRELPLKAEQVFQVVVAPLRRCLGPCAFQSAGDRVRGLAAAELVAPAETLLLDVRALRFGTDILWRRRSAVSFAEAVASSNQRNG